MPFGHPGSETSVNVNSRSLPFQKSFNFFWVIRLVFSGYKQCYANLLTFPKSLSQNRQYLKWHVAKLTYPQGCTRLQPRLYIVVLHLSFIRIF